MNHSRQLLASLSLAAALGCADSAPVSQRLPASDGGAAQDETGPGAAAGTGQGAAAGTGQGPGEWISRPLRLQRGITLGNRLDAPYEGAWGPATRESDFATIAARGFDHVRLPVRFDAHAQAESPFTLSAGFMERVDWAIGQAIGQELSVVLDFHYYDELMTDPEAHRERFVALWEQLAERYQDLPEQVAFELLSDPRDALTSVYNQLVQETVQSIRATNPTRVIIVDAPDSARPQALAELELPEDPHLVASAHLFAPELFTLQGVTWLTPEYLTTGVIFPGPPATPLVPVPAAQSVEETRLWFEQYNSLPTEENPSGPGVIRDAVATLVAFRNRTGHDVYLGQFGASTNGDLDSRVRFLTLVRESLEADALGWAVWDNNGSDFAVLGRGEGTWLDATIDALVPSDK